MPLIEEMEVESENKLFDPLVNASTQPKVEPVVSTSEDQKENTAPKDGGGDKDGFTASQGNTKKKPEYPRLVQIPIINENCSEYWYYESGIL